VVRKALGAAIAHENCTRPRGRNATGLAVVGATGTGDRCLTLALSAFCFLPVLLFLGARGLGPIGF
jgi:hypothetical protein